jgi:hypothetical protein
MTFKDLAMLCEKTFCSPAVIVEGRKVSGVRSINTAQNQIKQLCAFFGKRLINSLTTESLTDYKLWRLKNGSENKSHKENRPIKIATVNKELSCMRKMMRFAYGKGFVLKDIFLNAKVIDASAEIERTLFNALCNTINFHSINYFSYLQPMRNDFPVFVPNYAQRILQISRFYRKQSRCSLTV